MASTEPTEWEILRFGSKFQVAKDAAIASMYQAQARALGGAHLGGGARTEHAYGTQFAVAQFEELADHTRDLEGVELRKPENAKVQYELPLILETKTLLYPLRYGKDGKVKRDGAKITMSQVRRDLLHSGVARQAEKQFDLFEPLLSEEEIVRRQDAENELRAELLRSGRVVTIGIACSPMRLRPLLGGRRRCRRRHWPDPRAVFGTFDSARRPGFGKASSPRRNRDSAVASLR